MDRKSRPNPQLPTDIILSHILLRLPVKALLRCRCVCKSWSSLIRSPSFVTAFRNESNKSTTTNLLFRKNELFFSSKIEEEEQQGGNDNFLIPTPIAELPHMKQPCQPIQRPNHVQSVHGLACASSSSRHVSILNLSTRESIQLPHVKREYNTFATYHFGFSPLTNEYKVLQIFQRFRPKEVRKWDIQFNVFTLGTDSSWRPLRVDPGHLLFDALGYASVRNMRCSASVCVNGAIHWMYERQKMIVVFEVREEAFRVVPLPQDYTPEFGQDNHEYKRITDDYGQADASIIEVGGCVGVYADKSWKENKVVLWILKDHQNLVWVKETISVMPREAGFVEVLGTIHTGELAFALYLDRNTICSDSLCIAFTFGIEASRDFDDCAPQLHLYDMKSKRSRILDFDFSHNLTGFWDSSPLKLVSTYDDSIVPLK
ncbi:F-box/kelch-repeat protein [Prunus yedoensis var. nudiflora]|uniref:F-box/kelch-repeat protein n=1 Tax=Prunus yedoensis var. nudiflora TaxID=2094558 RepID=A0A314XKF9_PRUYE|nr:F-box/kelch-repeat protein [Prunus yedoensis var. nudiflora]